MRILLSNDDGIHAEGLITLAETLKELGELDVIAPDRDRSGASNSLTLDPLRPQVLSNGFVSLVGTPTDCVHLALTGFLDDKPDIVVSGINEGANLGEDGFLAFHRWRFLWLKIKISSCIIRPRPWLRSN